MYIFETQGDLEQTGQGSSVLPAYLSSEETETPEVKVPVPGHLATWSSVKKSRLCWENFPWSSVMSRETPAEVSVFVLLAKLCRRKWDRLWLHALL